MTLKVSMNLVCAALLLMGPAFAGEAPAAKSDHAGFASGVRPQDDLYRAVNGPWLKTATIPADKSSFGLAIQLRDRADARVKTLVEALATQTAAAGSVEEKIGNFYRSYLDTAAIDKGGLAPVEPWLAQIDALKNRHGLAVMMGRLQGVASTPLGPFVAGDRKDPGVNRVTVWQDGLGLPDRDYYLKDDARFEKARKAYLHNIETLLAAGGDAQAVNDAQRVFALEKRLATVQWPRAELRDPIKTYNPTTVQALATDAPGFDWAAFFAAAALPVLDRLSIGQPNYVKAVAHALAHEPLSDWKLYLRVRLLDDCAKVLPKPFRDARFDLRGRTLQGLEQPPPRWQDAIRALNSGLGEAVGQVYVAHYFPPENKARMQQLVSNLLAAFGDSIDGLTWMSPQTKAQARAKLAKYTPKIGYPDKWRDYSKLEVRDADAFGNVVRAGRFEWEREAHKAGRAVDRREWHMTPQTVNAYYNPNLNEVVFPAAILEPPLFDMKADDAVNYGAIGAIIGHEISHGFDDSGSRYDGDGRLNDWWTEADRRAFAALGDRLVAQFDAYEPLPGHHVDGRLTLGENIADLSGLQIAYKAYRRALGGKPAAVVDGLTGDQRFFLGWARAWRSKAREERTLQLLTIDPHAPDEYRANGAAMNSDAFQAAFGTHPGDRMYKAPAQRIRIW